MVPIGGQFGLRALGVGALQVGGLDELPELVLAPARGQNRRGCGSRNWRAFASAVRSAIGLSLGFLQRVRPTPLMLELGLIGLAAKVGVEPSARGFHAMFDNYAAHKNDIKGDGFPLTRHVESTRAATQHERCKGGAARTLCQLAITYVGMASLEPRRRTASLLRLAAHPL